MMAISASFTRRIRNDFSSLSASCPAVAENRKNGRMKTACARFERVLASNRLMPAAWNATSMIRAFLKTLSLKAPRNWVRKNGRKRLCLSSSYWLCRLISPRLPRSIGSAPGAAGRLLLAHGEVYDARRQITSHENAAWENENVRAHPSLRSRARAARPHEEGEPVRGDQSAPRGDREAQPRGQRLLHRRRREGARLGARGGSRDEKAREAGGPARRAFSSRLPPRAPRRAPSRRRRCRRR